MEPFGRLAGIGVIMAILIAYLRREQPTLGVPIGVAFLGLLLLTLVQPLSEVVRVFTLLGDRISGSRPYLETVLKAMGIAFLATFSSQISRDAGEEGVAVALELAGKVLILLLAVPIVLGIMDAILQLMP